MPSFGAAAGGARPWLPPVREKERDWRDGEMEEMGEDKNIQGDFCKYLPLWQHVACHVGACVVHLGPQTKHLTEFRDPDARFESLGTQVKSQDKFGDLGCNLLGQ